MEMEPQIRDSVHQLHYLDKMKNIIIYPGRFQPFGPHHFKSYQWLTKAFGVENVFIATSDHTDLNSPLTFEDKVLCISKYNIPSDKIVQVRNPYKAEEITSKFDPNETSIIFAYGEKDFGRIQFTKKDGTPGYIQEYYGQKNLKPLSQCGYALELPHVSLQSTGKEVSGTWLRQTLPLATRDEFTRIMGYYDEAIHFLFKQKFHPDINEMTETIIEAFSKKIPRHFLAEDSGRITKTQLQRIEQYADKIFKEFGIDVNFQTLSSKTHFYQRLNDPRNIDPITADELRQLFKKASLRYGHKLGKSTSGLEAVLKDMETDINLPFIIKIDHENEELDLVPKTIMRKKNFSSSSPILTMEQSREVFQAINSNAGKYSKHIIHPFEDPDLTDEELLEFVSDVLTKPETCSCSLKLDGHNFQVTYKNGQVLASRNKGTIVNPMTVEEVFEKYAGKDDVQFTFTNAHNAIAEHLMEMSHETLTDIFNDGRTFLNFEIIHPRARNVFEYGDKPFLSLHSLITYDEKGNEISRTKNIPWEFESMPRNGFEIKITSTFQLKPQSEQFQYFKSKFNPENKKLFIAELGNAVIKQFCKDTKQNSMNKTTQVKIITKSRILCKTDKDKSDFKSAYENLQRVGGIDSLNPIEGLVVEWRGRQFKLTGSFLLCVPIFRIYNQDRYKKV